MARVRFFNASETSDAFGFGEFTPGKVTSANSRRVVLTGEDGQKFIATGQNMSLDLGSGEATGRVTRVEWRGPDGKLWGVVDQVSVSVQRMIDLLFVDPDNPSDPHGPEALFLEVMGGDDLFVGPSVGDDDQVFTRYLPGGGDDTIRGSDANETVELSKGGGTVDFDGGGGRDTLFYLYGAFDTGRGVKVDLATGRIENPFGGVDTIRNVERIVGTLSADTMTGGRGDDTLDGGFGGRDRFDGGAGDDSLVAAEDAFVTGRDDTLIGGAGDDTLDGGSGDDVIDGGRGRDVLMIRAGSEDFVLDLTNPERNAGEHVGDRIRGVEEYRLTSAQVSIDVTFRGGAGDDGFLIQFGAAKADLRGGAGADHLGAGFTDDRLDGGTGSDTLSGGFGADTLIGGAGRDTVRFEDFSIALVDLKNPGRNTQEAVGDVYRSIEVFSGAGSFFGSDGDDVADGATSGQTYDGRGGDDSLSGGSRDSRLIGGAGNDTLFGGDNEFFSPLFADTLNGGAGGDLLISGESVDVMKGGAGADVFSFRKLADVGVLTLDTTASRDQVVDFKSGVDELRFEARGFEGLSKNFALVQGADPAAAARGKSTFLFDTTDDRLYLDVDGRGGDAAIFLMTLENLSRLRAADIDVV